MGRRRKNKPTNNAICIYRNSREIGKVLKVFQNTLPNFERPKYFLSEFYLDENDNQIGQKLLAKANEITDINRKLSDLLGYKVTLI